MIDQESMFPRSYSEARNRFLDLCQKRYIEVKTLAHADYGSSIACSGLIEPDTLISDNIGRLLRCQHDSKTYT